MMINLCGMAPRGAVPSLNISRMKGFLVSAPLPLLPPLDSRGPGTESGRETSRWKVALLALLLCAAAAIASPAQVTFTSLASFDGTNGSEPVAGLVQANDGNFYGTALGGGGSTECDDLGCGTVFRITPQGTLTRVYAFCAQTNCADGTNPEAGLIQATDGSLYGTASGGGTGAGGVVFKITTSGAMTTLYSFCSQTDCTDGESPVAALVQGSDGNFYGTTAAGGTGAECATLPENKHIHPAPLFGCGTVFKITPEGALTTLHSFCTTNCDDGSSPEANLIQGSDGNFYGTTNSFGANGAGTVFKITPTGTLTTLYAFCSQENCADGEAPEGGLVQAANANFYGTTPVGGANGVGGTVFQMTPAGTLTTLYSFCAQTNCTDGSSPEPGLVLASDGNFYGTTTVGGDSVPSSACDAGCGSIFRITAAGTLTTLYSFCVDSTTCPDGEFPEAPLVQATSGVFYGTTESGGAAASGAVFSLVVPLPVATLAPTSLDFGNQPVGVTSSPKQITFTNTGGENLLISSIVDANGFSQTNNCPVSPATLAINGSCTINVRFTPLGLGNASSTLVITDNVVGSPQMLPLSGVGGSSVPVASLAPSGLNFNTQLLGTTSAAQTVTLSNTGGVALTITSVGFIGANAADFKQSNNCGNSLAGGNSCTINVSFNPTAPGISNASATLVVADNASPSPQSIMVTGLVEGFSLSTNCTSLTVVPGQSAIYTVGLAPDNGFAQSVGLSCSGAPALATCTVNPNMITMDGSTTVQAQVTATTTPATSGFLQSPVNRGNSNRLAGLVGLAGMAGLAALVILPGKRRAQLVQQLWVLLFCLCLLSTAMTMSSCGGGGGSGGADPPGTAAGTYPLTVTATFQSSSGGTFTQKVSFNLVVQ